MELLKWELRKIWRPGILAAILLLAQISLSFLPNIELVTLLLLCYTAVFPLRQVLGAVLVFANMLFQSLGCSWRASFLAVCRQGLFFIPTVWILALTLGLPGIQMAQMVADLLTFLCSVPIQTWVLKKLSQPQK